MQIVAVDRYLGPSTIECTNQPVQGRSGGGLFNDRGELVGVCSAADPWLRRGIYGGLRAIHSFLDQAGLAHLYRAKPRLGQPDMLASAPSKKSNGSNTGPALKASQQPGRLRLPMPSPEQIGLHVTARTPATHADTKTDRRTPTPASQSSLGSAQASAAGDGQLACTAAPGSPERESPWQPLQGGQTR